MNIERIKSGIISFLKISAWFITAVIILLVALTTLDRLEKQDARQHLKLAKPMPVAVKTVVAERGKVVRWVMGEGTAEAVRKHHLQFESTGKVVFLAMENNGTQIREGSKVYGPKKGEEFGQLLARLDLRDRNSDILRSEAELAEVHNGVDMEKASLIHAHNEYKEAQSDFVRKKQLFEKKLVPTSEFEHSRTDLKNAETLVNTAEARLAAAESRVRAAKAQLNISNRGRERTSLFAPFDGVIGRINIKLGDYIGRDDLSDDQRNDLSKKAPIIIIDPSEMEISLSLPVYDGRYVHSGQEAVVISGALDWFSEGELNAQKKLFGKVYSVSPQLDAEGRFFRVKVRLKQKSNEIPDGMFVTCWIVVEKKEEVLRLPMESLLFKNDQPYVFTVQNSTVQLRNIKLGIVDDAFAEVLDGLQSGETVVTKGRRAVSHGTLVRVAGSKS